MRCTVGMWRWNHQENVEIARWRDGEMYENTESLDWTQHFPINMLPVTTSASTRCILRVQQTWKLCLTMFVLMKWRVQKAPAASFVAKIESQSVKAVVAAFWLLFFHCDRSLACLGCSGGQVQTPAAEFANSHGAIKCTDPDGARLLSEVLHSQHWLRHSRAGNETLWSLTGKAHARAFSYSWKLT